MPVFFFSQTKKPKKKMENIEYFDPEEFGGKGKARRAAKKEKRQENRAEKKKVRFENRTAKKGQKIAAKQQRIETRQAAKTERTGIRTQGRTDKATVQAENNPLKGVQDSAGNDYAPQLEDSNEYNALALEKTAAGVAAAAAVTNTTPSFMNLVNSQPETKIDEALFNTLERDNLHAPAVGYLANKGYAPDEIADDNDILLAAQIANAYNNDVEEIAEQQGLPYADAEELLWSYDESLNTFDPVTMAFIKAAGEKAIQKIGMKQAEKGKPFLGNFYDPKTGRILKKADPKQYPTLVEAAKDVIGSGVGGVEKKKTEDAYKEAMPYLIGGGLLLVFIGFLAARNS